MGVASIIKQIFVKEDFRTDDKLGVYPEKVHVPAFLERRYLKTSRAIAVISILSMCVNIMLGSILYLQPSMVQSMPGTYSYNEQFQGFKPLEKMYTRKPASDIIFEEKIREYIFWRYKVMPDVDIMKFRWDPGSVYYWMSGRDVYSKFQSLDYMKTMEAITKSGYKQDVYFRWSRKISSGKWVAEFDTYEYYDWQTKKATVKRWRVYMIVVINNAIQYGSLEFALKNPLNISIIGFYPVSINIDDKDKS